MRFKPVFHFSMLVLIAYFCCSCNQNLKMSTSEVEKVARDTMGQGVQITYNADSTLALCESRQKQAIKQPLPKLHVMVLDRKDKENVFQAQFTGGEVHWYDDHTLLIKRALGIASPENPNGIETFLYNLEKKKRLSYNEEDM